VSIAQRYSGQELPGTAKAQVPRGWWMGIWDPKKRWRWNGVEWRICYLGESYGILWNLMDNIMDNIV